MRSANDRNLNVPQLLADLGLRTFPLPKGSKAATIHNFSDHAAIDPHHDFDACNLAVATGDGVIVLDFDTKSDSGIDGTKVLKALDTLGLPPSLRVKTPNGLHVYLSVPPGLDLRNRVGLQGMAGVDVRAHHGYVVAPGSSVGGLPYEIIGDVPSQLDPAPDFVLKMCARVRGPDPDTSIPATEPDQPHIVKRATEWLTHHAPEAVQGAGGDRATLTVAYHLRDIGCSEQTAFELMSTYWNHYKASPPWDAHELQQKVTNAYTYPSHQQGAHDVTAEFPPLDPEDLARIAQHPTNVVNLPERTSAPFRSWETIDFASIPPRQPLYGNHYIRKFMSTTVAPGALGKSSLVLAEAVSMAIDRSLLGAKLHANRPLKVAYYNAEDPYDEIQRRVAAICQFHGVDQSLLVNHLFIASGRDNPILFATGEAGTLNEEAFRMIEHWGRTVGADVMVFDPLANMTTSPETNEVFRAIGWRLSRMADTLECSVEIVHHTRKLNGNEATVEDGRGGSALLAAARAGRVLNKMTKDEAAKAGLATHVDHFRIEADGKNNLTRAMEVADWYVRESVRLPQGDAVAAVAKWSWPDVRDELSAEVISAVVRRVRERGDGVRADVRANGWVGSDVAAVMGLDLDDEAGRARAKDVVKVLMSMNVLRKDAVEDRRQGRTTVVVSVGAGADVYENGELS